MYPSNTCETDHIAIKIKNKVNKGVILSLLLLLEGDFVNEMIFIAVILIYWLKYVMFNVLSCVHGIISVHACKHVHVHKHY